MISRRQREWAKNLLNEEKNYIIKDPGGRLSIALVYPNRYYVGMSNLGFQTIYAILNKRQDIVCERFFLPDFPLLPQETLISLENQRPLREFAVIAFSVSYENDYPAILKMLDFAQVDLEAEKRSETDPLIILGGACSGFNPEPLSRFIDCFLVGEGEEIIHTFLAQYHEWGGQGNREDFLLRLGQNPSFYVPRFYQAQYHSDGTVAQIVSDKRVVPKISRAVIPDLNLYETSTQVITPNTEFGHMFLLEISRGCCRQCRFCLMRALYKPYRRRKIESLLPTINRGLTYRDTIGLVSASPTDHPDLLALCTYILEKGGKVSISSLRFESITEEFLQCLLHSGHKTITLAPEAGNERLRYSLGKEITDEEIFSKIRLITKAGIPHLKLYFMIGLPSETEADVEAIENLLKKIKHVILQTAKQKTSIGKITLSLNCFVPKPLTAFERCPMESIPSLKAKQKFLAKRIKQLGNVEVLHDVPRWAYIQGLLARGDRRVGELLQQAHQAGGNWKEVFRTMNLNPDFYALRQRSPNECLPWDLFHEPVE